MITQVLSFLNVPPSCNKVAEMPISTKGRSCADSAVAGNDPYTIYNHIHISADV